jgi:hypothetical protein
MSPTAAKRDGAVIMTRFALALILCGIAIGAGLGMLFKSIGLIP